jgi:phosphohistidine phosphatase
MRLLLLLRHAKAAPNAADGEDHSRPLNERGHAAAAAMGRWLAGRPATQPQLALISTARRTRETWAGMAGQLPPQVQTRYERALYLAPPQDILNCIAKVPNDIERLMVVGHNPGTHELARALVGMIGARPAARLAFDRMRDNFPTGALTVLAFPKIRNWADVAVGKGRFESFTRPRDIALKRNQNTPG